MNINSNDFEEEELPDVIAKRKGSRNYMMRFSIKGHGQQRVALGTDNLAVTKVGSKKTNYASFPSINLRASSNKLA